MQPTTLARTTAVAAAATAATPTAAAAATAAAVAAAVEEVGYSADVGSGWDGWGKAARAWVAPSRHRWIGWAIRMSATARQVPPRT